MRLPVRTYEASLGLRGCTGQEQTASLAVKITCDRLMQRVRLHVLELALDPGYRRLRVHSADSAAARTFLPAAWSSTGETPTEVVALPPWRF